MEKVLVVGASSGVGRALTERLVLNGYIVWGVARRMDLLSDTKKKLGSNFCFSSCDVSEEKDWLKLVRALNGRKFIPQIVIFCAAILENDLSPEFDTKILKKIVSINFLGIIIGVEKLLKVVKPNAQFIAISSSSAFKGSGEEGIGYAASKAALSIAFESLYLKFKNKIRFKTIFFGPIRTGMNPFIKQTPFVLSEKAAVDTVIAAISNNKVQYYSPWNVFFAINLAKLLPSFIYLHLLEQLDQRYHKKFVKTTL